MSEETGVRRRGPKLVRAVGFWGLVAFCINAVVGSGVYLLPSRSFDLIGPFSLWAPLIFSIPVFILALCFSEAASHFTQPGGPYLYARTAFGDFIGFETGFMNTLARISSVAALSNGFVDSLARVVPEAGGGLARAVLIGGSLGLFALIHASGVKYGARTIYGFTLGKLLPLFIFVVVAVVIFKTNPIPASFHVPGPEAKWNEAALLLLFAYAGFENLGVAAGEYKNPRKELPIALLVGILSIAAIYSLVQLAALSALPDLSETKTPIADAAFAVMGTGGALLISIGAIISILGTNLGTVLEAPRMIYALSLERSPYRWVASVHDKFRTPYVAIFLFVGVAIPVAIIGSFTALAILSAVARLTTYLFTAAAIPKLRRLNEGFRAPGGLAIPILGVLIALGLFATLEIQHLVAAIVGLSVGGVLWGIGRAVSGPMPELVEEE
ncbi:MAG: APC family permease [Thermoanaerobaculia bacterium]|nr:APC family permease [Thermoanaerobaculia bacterium]